MDLPALSFKTTSDKRSNNDHSEIDLEFDPNLLFDCDREEYDKLII